ncbi:uncharacterized protein LOC128549080 isoform X2 [Mercenaria mercenaria]|uniref:uncharacterized protein LOC128549080 isoform X2 n=1 Tax=Mercenaria mercenaria TaxID=6596 RepID=UPI00234F9862|nr:uncharacterized protein LOC128549080 isoform X2 [Mercenaria mercenaria]
MDRGKKTSKYAKLSRKATVQTDNSPNPVAKPKRKISVKSKDAKKSKTKQTFPANDKPTSTVPTKDNKRKRRVPKRFQDDAAVTVPGKDQSEYSSASESDSDSDSDSDRDSLFNTITEHTSMLADRTVQDVSATHGSKSNRRSKHSSRYQLNKSVLDLLNQSLSKATRQSYKQAYKHYLQFASQFYPCEVVFPITVNS